MDNRIINYNEKKVIVARQIMILNMESAPENVITEWEKILRTKCKYIGYGAKLVDCPKNELAKYIIFTRGKKYSGNYDSMCCMIGRIREDLRLKEKKQ